ncbi:MAG: phosphatidylglycerophosphatase A [Porticoccaceae bacterium]
MLAFGFGSGLVPKAPGTMGSLVALPLWLLLYQLPMALYWLFILLATVLGIYICGRAATKLGVHDHPGIVWDEFVGLWIAMAFLSPTLSSVICGFVLFRFFDIVKPWPIGWLDKKLQGGIGIMIDDIVAGIFAAVIAGYLSYLGYL